MALRVPGQGRDTVAGPDAQFEQRVGQAPRPRVQSRVRGADDRPFDAAGDDLALPMPARRVIENAIDGQGPVLHQAKQSSVLHEPFGLAS